MADPNLFYSYLGSEPTVLPHRIRLSSGLSRTDNATFTDKELLDAGFIGPYIKPEKTENIFSISWDSNDLEYKVVTNDEQELNSFKEKLSGYLLCSDWAVALDSPLPENLKNEWIEYRKKLNDLKGSVTDPDGVILPDFPSYEY